MFSWDEYLKFAKALSTQSGITETEFRVSISRAYYAIFNNCSDRFFELTQTQKPNSDSHKFIIDKYKEGKKEARAIGFHLDSLKNHRIDSDYKANKAIQKSTMDTALKLADSIIEKLNSVTDEHFHN